MLNETIPALPSDGFAETIIVENIIEDAWRLRDKNIDKAAELVTYVLSLLDQERSMAENKDADLTKIRHARASVVHSFILRRKENYTQSLIHSLDVVEILNNASDQLWLGRVYGNIGGLFLHLGLRYEAVDYLIRQLEIGKSIGDVELELTAYHNLGMAYMVSANYALASTYFEKAIPFIDAQYNTVIYAYGVSNLAQCQIHLEEYEKARSSLNNCLSLCRSTKVRHAESVILRLHGVLEEALGDYSSAWQLYNESSEINQEHGNIYTGVLLNQGLGRCNLHLEDYQSALKALTSALNGSITLGERSLTYQSHELLADAYRAIGDVEQAFSHFQEFHSIKESVFNIRSEQRIEQMKIVYEKKLLLQSWPSTTRPTPNRSEGNYLNAWSLATEQIGSENLIEQRAIPNKYKELINGFEPVAHEIRSELTIISLYNALLESQFSSLSREQREGAHEKIRKSMTLISSQLHSVGF